MNAYKDLLSSQSLKIDKAFDGLAVYMYWITAGDKYGYCLKRNIMI